MHTYTYTKHIIVCDYDTVNKTYTGHCEWKNQYAHTLVHTYVFYMQENGANSQNTHMCTQKLCSKRNE